MDKIVNIFLICNIISYCNGVSFQEQLKHIAKRRQENLLGLDNMKLARRFNSNPGNVILGSPSMASHLPEAEAIIPGHTLIRPAMGMLKSAVKFPHRLLENGAGVYGNIENLGIRYDGKSERVLYSGFRRMPEHLIMVIPKSSGSRDLKLDEKRNRPKYSDPKLNINTLQDNFSKSKSLNNQNNLKKRRYKKPTIGPGYAYVNLEDLGLLRTGNEIQDDMSIQKLSYNLEEIASDSSDDREAEGNVDNDDSAVLGQDSDNIDEGKKAWFWKTKDAYNHIKINPEAPDHEELMPSQATPKIRDWWFYHEGDFEALDVA